MGQLSGAQREGPAFWGRVYAGYRYQYIYRPGQFINRIIRAFLDAMKTTEPADGVDEVLVPGDFEYCNRRHRLAHGIEIPDPINEQLREWADRLEVPVDDRIVEDKDRGALLSADDAEKNASNLSVFSQMKGEGLGVGIKKGVKPIGGFTPLCFCKDGTRFNCASSSLPTFIPPFHRFVYSLIRLFVDSSSPPRRCDPWSRMPDSP